MDPLTHGLIGSTAAQSPASKEKVRYAAIVGFSAALLADADIFITNPSDPLLNVEIHRQFSHSLIFIPIGALIASLLLWFFFKEKLSPKEIYGFSLLGYATAGLMDSFTSYGTKLLWPFTDERYSWNIISVFDPLFTVGILIFVLLCLYHRKKLFLWLGWLWIFCYLLLGFFQHERTEKKAYSFAKEQNQSIEGLVVKPTIGNQLLWSIRYVANDTLYAHGLYLNPFLGSKFYEGTSTPLLDWRKEYETYKGTTLYNDIRRFEKLSEGYLIRHPEQKDVIGDGRYAMLPTSLSPLWGIKADTSQPHRHVQFLNFRNASEEIRSEFLKMLFEK
ncbi:metal-dependent hydrolase [Aliifodinibius salicampi]|uniref:Metal-dependent hydrolase n=1 Tax=Fodinibius salicampi TaxID=1920655 RepID=A0ABT3PVU5_9BACT|nr:metal-dependent hydrolase [Fodinibius salicampi]MCW9711984.1 metal-dependent hydrolase [Fodinibius salicampi]